MGAARKKESPLRDRIKSSAVYTSVSIRMHFEPVGWAVFVIDENLGALSIQSDWGEYSYAWGHGGRGGKSLLEFLATASDGYIGSKLLVRTREIIDAEATRKEMKKQVRDWFQRGNVRSMLSRGGRWISESEFDLMRSLMSEIGEFYSNIRDLEPNTDLYPHAGELMREVFDPLYEHIVTRMHPWHAFLYQELVPTFQAYLRGEIDGHVPPGAQSPAAGEAPAVAKPP